MEKILIVEDELIVARDLRKTLERNGYQVTGVARSVEKALQLIAEEKPSLVLLDIFLKGDLTGIDLALQLNKAGIPFVYVSANASQPALESAKSTNPFGFIVKPFREKDLLVTIDIARYRHAQEQRLRQSSVASGITPTNAPAVNAVDPDKKLCEGIVGNSAPMLHVFNLIAQVAPFDTSVLITGETGTGKECVAQCIFQQSLRHAKPFLKLNCAALPAGLIEAELFGFEKGAFSGATESKAGKFEQAAGGTILLDEIGEMPLDMQVKLLRVLQEKEIQRIGGHRPIATDVRIIASTNRHMEKEVATGRFRLDLYYRLQVFPIELPPLRDRKEDIPLLVHHFLQFYNRKMNKQIHAPDEKIISKLMDYGWPGNVRQLQHLIERNMLLASQDHIADIVLPEAMELPGPETRASGATESGERERILRALQQANFRVSGQGGAAELLDITPSALYALIKKYGIQKGYSG